MCSLLLTAAAAAQTDTGEAILARHLESLGGRAALASGDVRLEGTLEANAPPVRLVVRIRRDPFGYREEVGSGDSVRVYLSDGRYAWTVDGGKSRLLEGARARSLLEFACIARHGYLEPGWIDAWQPRPMPAWEVDGGPIRIAGGQACLLTRSRTPAGTTFALYFDAADGRLHGMMQEGQGPRRWTRFADWTRSGSRSLALVRADGCHGSPVVEWRRFSGVETGLVHDPGLFPTAPVSEPPVWDDVAPLDLLPTPVPGTALTLHTVEVRVGALDPRREPHRADVAPAGRARSVRCHLAVGG
jgi:hypothetical protein